jgi:hypothetical protein
MERGSTGGGSIMVDGAIRSYTRSQRVQATLMRQLVGTVDTHCERAFLHKEMLGACGF